MNQIEDCPLLARVIETMNNEYPDDLLNQAYEMLLEGEVYDIGDTLAVFIVSEVASIVPEHRSVRSALRAVSDHFLTTIEDIQALRKAIN